MGGTGYEKFSELTLSHYVYIFQFSERAIANTQDNTDYENVFYKDTYAQTTTILSSLPSSRSLGVYLITGRYLYDIRRNELGQHGRTDRLLQVSLSPPSHLLVPLTLLSSRLDSYDYGAGINENRILTPKMAEMRLQGSFLRVSRDLLSAIYVGNGTNFTSSNSLFTQELRNEDTGAGFYFVRHADSTSVVHVSVMVMLLTFAM
jgi:hypothetical protein